MIDPAQDPLLHLAVQRGVLTVQLAERCVVEARRRQRAPRELLLEFRVLDAAVVERLCAELEPSRASTLAPSSPGGATPTFALQPGAREAEDPALTLAPGAAQGAPPAAAALTLVPSSPAPLASAVDDPPAGEGTWMSYPPPGEAAATNAAEAATRAGSTSQPAARRGEVGRPGERLGDDFELLDRLGAGGMGVVFRARQLSQGREVALKLLPPAGPGDAAGRFMREAKSATGVHDPHVVSTWAAGADPETGRLFIVMELMQGGDAEGLLAAAGGRLPEVRALEVVRDCARGLQALEKAGLVHRDIKPENVFLTPEGVAKLGDLGLARLQSGDDRLTATGTVVGTPCYMSPEQAIGEKDLDSRSDIYALAATLVRLISGQRPFAGGSVARILNRIVSEPPPDLTVLAPGTTRVTAELVKRAMSKAREDRPPDAATFLNELERALEAARAAPPPRPVAPSGGGRGALVALGALALVAIAAAAVWALTR